MCMKRQMMFVKECGVFDAIMVSIPSDESLITGYRRAMVGLKELNVDEIMAGCKEEITSKGTYLAQSFILDAYVTSMIIQDPFARETSLFEAMQRMNSIISDANIPDKIKHQAKFCRANLYMRIRQFSEANCDLKSLESLYGETGLFHVIKSCAIYTFALNDERFYEPLLKCAAILPDVFDIHLKVLQATLLTIHDSTASRNFLVSSLEGLVMRFPTKLTPRMLLIHCYFDLTETSKATKMLREARKDFPDRTEEMIGLYGLLKPKHPSCVNFFRRAIRERHEDVHSFTGLLKYFASTTHEYAKAIEVSTKAMYNFLDEEDFEKMFKHRQHLLKRIIEQNFWDKL